MSDTLTIPYAAGMQLGSLCNAYTNAVGHGLVVFEDASPQVVTWNKMKTSYKRVNTDAEARQFLSVSARLSLGARATGSAGQLGFSAGYLNETSKRAEYVEILQSIDYSTKTESVRPDLKPTGESKDLQNNAVQPTHYVRSIHYGGYLLSSYRFMLKEVDHHESSSVGASLDGSWLAAGGNVGASMEKEASEHAFISSTQVRYWTSVNVDAGVQDPEGLQKIMDNFVEGIKMSNNGDGIPMFVELAPLTFVFPFYHGLPPFNRSLETYLHKLQCLSDEVEGVYGDAHRLVRSVMERPLAFNLMDDLQDFLAETYPMLAQVRDAIDRLDFMATSMESLFKKKDPETNTLIKDGLGSKSCEEMLDLSYRCRYEKLKCVINSVLSREEPILQTTLEYSAKSNKIHLGYADNGNITAMQIYSKTNDLLQYYYPFLVTVIQIRYLPSGGLIERNPDAYVVATLFGPDLHRMEERTETIQDSKNPVYNVSRALSFEVTLEQLKTLTLQFDVYDKELVSADVHLVTTTIDLKAVRISTGQTRRDGLWVEMDRVD